MKRPAKKRGSPVVAKLRARVIQLEELLGQERESTRKSAAQAAEAVRKSIEDESWLASLKRDLQNLAAGKVPIHWVEESRFH